MKGKCKVCWDEVGKKFCYCGPCYKKRERRLYWRYTKRDKKNPKWLKMRAEYSRQWRLRNPEESKRLAKQRYLRSKIKKAQQYGR